MPAGQDLKSRFRAQAMAAMSLNVVLAERETILPWFGPSTKANVTLMASRRYSPRQT